MLATIVAIIAPAATAIAHGAQARSDAGGTQSRPEHGNAIGLGQQQGSAEPIGNTNGDCDREPERADPRVGSAAGSWRGALSQVLQHVAPSLQSINSRGVRS